MSDFNTRLRTVIGAEIARGREAGEYLRQHGWTTADDAWNDGIDAAHRYRLRRQHMLTAHYATVLLEVVDDHRPDTTSFEHTPVCSSPLCIHHTLHGIKRFTQYPCRLTLMVAQQLGVQYDGPPIIGLTLTHSTSQAPDPN